MSNKRILILTNRVPHPLNDGGNLAMHALVQGYHNAGWQVYLLAMNTSRHFLPEATLGNIYNNIHKFETVYVNNDIKVLPTLANFLFSQQPNHAVRFYNQAYTQALSKAITDFQPDVVHIESVFLTGYLSLVKKLTNATTVLRMHNVEYQVWQRLALATNNIIKRTYLNDLANRIRKYELAAWRQYDLLLPITESDAAVVQQVLPAAKMLVVPFGIDISGQQRNNEEAWEAYHIGAMDWLPNAEAIKWFLLEAWPLIHEKHPAFKFSFAGRNMPGEFYQMNIPGAVCYGEVADAQEFIADKKILVVPLHSGGGIRVKILEAMAAGKIVISTTIGMQGIDAIPGKHFIQTNTATGFSVAIDWVLSNKEQAINIGYEATCLIKEKYDAKNIQSQLINWLMTNI